MRYAHLAHRRNNIHFFTTNSELKVSVVERFNRTLKTRMWKYFPAKNTRVYIDILQDIVQGYNNSYHRSIGRTPASVNLLNVGQVRRKLYCNSWMKPRRDLEFKLVIKSVLVSHVALSRRAIFPSGLKKFSLVPRLFQEFHQYICYEIMLTIK